MNETRMKINASRFFVDKKQIETDKLFITGGDARHIKSVLRKVAGDRIIVCDGAGMDFNCELTHIGKSEIRAGILNAYPSSGEPPVKVTLYQSLPKSDKMEYVIQKCVEGGIYKIVPVISAFTQFSERLKDDSVGKRLARWRRISYEAAKQSGRGIVPEISDALSFSDAINACARNMCARNVCARATNVSPEIRQLALIPYENEEKTTLKSALKAFKLQDNFADMDLKFQIFIFIGPEGGFSLAEIDYCIDNHVIPVSLGPRILKTESAGFAVLCQIIYEFGN